jgi:hypothetical protein
LQHRNGFRDLEWGGTGGLYQACGPDRMHLLLEGLCKSLVDFVLPFIKRRCEHEGVPNTSAELERRVQHFYTRHNTELPSCAFSKGIKKHDAIAAKQMVPLLMAMHVSIGSDNSILTNSDDQQELQCFMSEFLRLLRNLHQRVYTEHELVECEGHMLRVLAAMKLMFMQESKSQFQFIKFHIVKHVFWQIR